MPAIRSIVAFLASPSPRGIALILMITSALLVISERRFSLLPLLVQYALVGLLTFSQLHRAVGFARIGVGLAICLILYITADHVQSALSQGTSRAGAAPDGVLAGVAQRIPVTWHLGTAFRFAALVLAIIVAVGLWRDYPLSFMPDAVSLCGYWLVTTGLLLTVMGLDPLQKGLGVLIVASGFELMYLFLQSSLLVIGLLSVVDVLMGLTVAYCTENWLESFTEEDAG